ncbi:MAG: hypothetical protein Q8N36_03585, partial [bacterium]|nr:hypothetical protein [bacterium]
MYKKIIALIALLALLGLALAGLFSRSISAAPTMKYLTIIHTNDEHSMLLPTPLSELRPDITDLSIGGFARLATVVAEV